MTKDEEKEAIKKFLDMVCYRAETYMLIDNKLEGKHYMAMMQLYKELYE